MNYYERHIGDFIRDTVGLSMIEDGAYNRLLDQCYQTERPIPKEMVYRLARATSRAERKAVDFVLSTFFDLADGGYRQKRVDAEIAKFLEGEPEREAKRQNAADRQRHARERRRALYEELRELGIVLSFDATTRELEVALSRAKSQPPSHAPSQPVTRDNTANQTPDTRHQLNPYPPDGGSSTTPPVDRPPLALVPSPPGPPAAAPPAPDCPHQQIVDAFHRIRPELPQVRAWTPTRRAHLSSRWKADAKRRSLGWWERLFGFIGDSPFLLGHSAGRDGGRPFVMTLDWLVKSEENLVKVIEGNYHEAQG